MNTIPRITWAKAIHHVTLHVAWWFFASWGLAQQPSPPTESEPITAETVQRKLSELENAKKLDDAAKAKVRDLLQQTLQEIKAIERRTSEAAEHRKAAKSATADAQKVRSAIDNLSSAETSPIPSDLSVPELRERLASRQSDLPKLQTAAKAAEAEPNRRNARRRKISQLLGKLQEEKTSIEGQLKTAPPADEPVELTSARQDYLSTHLRAVERHIDALESERTAYDATVDLLPLRRRLSALELAHAERLVEQLEDAIAQRQREDVNKQLRDAEQALAELALLGQTAVASRPVAEETVRFARQRLEIRGRSDAARTRLTEVRRQLEQLRAQAERTRQQIDQVGLSNAIGQLLRRHRIELLPDEKSLEAELSARQAEIQTLQQSMFELEDRRRQLDGPSRRTSQRIMNRWEASGPPDTPSKNLQAKLQDGRLQQLEFLISDAQTYFYKLVDLDSAQRELLAQSQKYSQFIDEHALWIRGAGLFQLTDARHAASAATWLIDPEGWRAVGRTLVEDFRANPALTLGALALVVLLFGCQRRASRQIIELGDNAMRSTTQKFAPTLLAFVLTVVSAASWPMLMAYPGWRLGVTSASRDFSYALAIALGQTAAPFFLLVLARQTCRAKGLAGAHFGWTNTDLARLRRWLRLLMVLTLPLVFVVSFYNAVENPLGRYSLGRGALVLLGLIVAAFAHRLLRPKRGLLYQVSAAARDGWLRRGGYVLYVVAVAIPISLAVLAATGYYVAAFRLAERAMFSAAMLFALLLVGSLLFRWVLVTRRWLAVQQARRKREAQVAAQPETTPAEPASTSEDAPIIAPEPEIDLAEITAQTRRFLWAAMAAAGAAGLWLIWIDVLPALRFLDRVEMWHTSVQITETVETITGSVITREIPQVEAVTLADVTLAIVLAAMTIIAVRNLPGLLEMGIWQRTPLDAGARFAISAATRYLLFIAGVLVISYILGFAWSKVGWLVAALTVGLGFGLQEIFANFVSGLIVLAERPVRVGDLVTIGNINGTVQRIQMRATTIRDWNHRELVVPNKKLVTENLINWTLTDSNYRVDLVIGIAYGSDTEKAREILLRIAADHPKILEKPRPKAIFRAFGNSSLEIEYRIYIPHMDFWPRVTTEINTAIAREFKQAGIEIAFPQRDLHIRSIRATLPLSDERPLPIDGRDRRHEPTS